MRMAHRRAGLGWMLGGVLLALTACGGGEPAPAAAPVESLAQASPAQGRGLPMVADAAQAPQATPAWVPKAAGLMQWAEQTYPHLFPAGPQDRTWSSFTYRRYPETGNLLAVAGEGIYIAGPVSGGPAVLVGRLADFSCTINPEGCLPSASLAVVPPVATSAVVVPSSVVPGVTAVLYSPQRISATLFPGQQMNSITLSGGVSGDIRQLAGRTLYIIVEDPHALFNSPPGVSIGASSVQVYLTAKPLTATGIREGNLRVYACLDAACGTQLAASPLLVPYRVSVIPQVTTDQTRVVAQAAFGQVPADRAVRVTLPPGTTDWRVQWTGGSLRTQAATTNQLGNSAGTVTFSFRPAAPGSYSDRWSVSGTASDGAGANRTFSTDISVDYTVTDSAAATVSMAPAETRVTVLQGDAERTVVKEPVVAARAGASVTRRGVEYLTWPAGVSEQDRFSWWSGNFDSEVTTCWYRGCLPAGTYTGRVVYSVTQGTGTTSVYHPITMRIVP